MNVDIVGQDRWKSKHKIRVGDLNSIIKFDYIFKNFAEIFQDKNFIEIGCIPGDYCAYFKLNFNCKITGLDYGEEEFFKYTMNKYGIKDYKYIKMDFLNHLPTKKYDVVSSFWFY